VLAALLGGVLILGAWHVRNWTVGGFSGFSAQFSHVIRSADFEVWLANNPRARGEAIRNEWKRLGLESPTAILPPLRVDHRLPVRFRLYLRGVWRTLSNPGVLAWLQFLDLEPEGMAASRGLIGTGPWSFFVQSIKDRPRVVAGSVILGTLNLAYWALFAVGSRGMMRRSRAVAWAAGLFISYFALTSGGPWGQSRFRMPFVSALCVIAAVAVDNGTGRKTAAEPETTG
jgi:hypothetical protein